MEGVSRKEYNKDISSIKTDVAVIKTDILYIKESLSKIEKNLNGNGSPGIIMRLDKLETFRDKVIGALLAMNAIWAVIIGLLKFLR